MKILVMSDSHHKENNVKLGLWSLADEAKNAGCKVALYGHTHIQALYEKEGVMLFNPGAAESGHYGIVTIDNNGQLAFEKKIM